MPLSVLEAAISSSVKAVDGLSSDLAAPRQNISADQNKQKENTNKLLGAANCREIPKVLLSCVHPQRLFLRGIS